MGFRETIESAIKDPNISFLGQIVLSDDEYNELLKYTRRKVSNMEMGITAPYDIFISVALVQIAIRNYKEGNYWEYFKDELGVDVSSSRTNYVGQIFISTLNKYHLFQLDREPGSKYAYVENIKAHAIVPNNYMGGYWDFISSFYDKNLLRQLPENIDTEFMEMSDFFSTLNESSDSFTLKSLDSKPSKSYKLLKATRSLFAQGDPIALSNIVYSHLKIIDDYYYDGIKASSDDRFALSFSKWVEKENEIVADRDKKAKRRSEIFYRKPYFSIDRKNEIAYLNIPEQKIRNDEYDGSISAIVCINGMEETYKLGLYRAFGVLVTDPVKIPIYDIFTEIEVIIKTKSERSFVINRQNYRIFDEEFYELPKLRKGKNYILVQKHIAVRGEKPIYVNPYNEEWDEYSYEDINEKSVVYIDDSPISIIGSFALGVDFAFESKEYELYYNGNKVQTCYKHPNVSFKISNDTLPGSFLIINNERYNIWNMASSIVELPEEKNTSGVTFILDELLSNKSGVYEVILDEPGKNNRQLCKYVYLPDLRCRSEKFRYIFGKEAIINIYGNYDIEPQNCYETENSRYVFSFSNEVEYAAFLLNLDEMQFSLTVPLRVFKYGFEGNLQTAKLDYLWFKDLKNDLHIYMPGASEVCAYMTDKEHHDIEIPGDKIGENYFRIDISYFVRLISEKKTPFNYINIKFKDNKQRSLSLFRVLNRLYVEKIELVLDGHNKVAADVSYLGKDELLLNFIDDNNIDIVERKVSNGINYFPELLPNRKYTLIAKQYKEDEFGFGGETKELFRRYGAGVIDYKDLTNCELSIKRINYNNNPRKLDRFYWISDLYRRDEFTYLGSLYERKISEKPELRFKPSIISHNVLVECIPEENALSVISIQTEYEDGVYDPLYYDKKMKTLVISDNVSSTEYNRFLPLYDDRTEFVTSIRRK